MPPLQFKLSRFFALLLAFLAVPGFLQANVKLSALFSNNMVLQRDVEIPVWGMADPGESVTVTLGSDTATATTDSDGKWMVKLPKLPASSTPADLVITGKNTVTFKNVLIGDVWLASGQSNMEMAFFWKGETGKEAAKAIDSPLIRIIKIPDVAKDTPQPTLDKGGWGTCAQSGGVLYMSELPYYFAKDLQDKLNIPIGVINSSCSGTPIESWMSAETLAADPAGPEILDHWKQVRADYPAKKAKYDVDKAAWDAAKAAAKAAGTPFNEKQLFPPGGEEGSPQTPSGLYNAMIYPLAPFALKGIVWYQGENNSKHSERYRTFLPEMIKNWRTLFGQGDLPFIWVQLPNYNMGTEFGDNWAGVREAQNMTLSVPNTAQVVTIDIGQGNEIHPNNKDKIGQRLANVVLVHVYGDKTIVDSGPVFDHADLSANPVRVYFTHVADGLKQAPPPPPKPPEPGKPVPPLKPAPEGITGFALAGDDQVFHPAEAKIDGSNTVLVSCSAVPNPVAVRYAWSNDPEGLNLVNSADLPLAPFRTDTWPEPEPKVKAPAAPAVGSTPTAPSASSVPPPPATAPATATPPAP